MTSTIFPYVKNLDDKDILLICFHHAGGAASNYVKLARLIDARIAVCGVQLPGRENSHRDPFAYEFGELVDCLLPEIDSLIDRPTFFLGHSLGALCAYEVLKKLTPSPYIKGLFVSACSSPRQLNNNLNIQEMSDEEFNQILIKYGGIDQDMLNKPKFIEYLLPRLKSDFRLFANYPNNGLIKIDIPIIALYGLSDGIMSPDSIQDWRCATAKGFTIAPVQGAHFYHTQCNNDFVDVLHKHISETLDKGVIYNAVPS